MADLVFASVDRADILANSCFTINDVIVQLNALLLVTSVVMHICKKNSNFLNFFVFLEEFENRIKVLNKEFYLNGLF